MINRSIRAFAGVLAVVTPIAIVCAGDPPGNPEVEPNDSKAAATPCASGGAGMVSGDIITGTSTGTSAFAGNNSLDTFRVRTAAANLGIYRHRLVLTSATPGHTGSIRGLQQVIGTIQNSTDVAFQTSSPSTSPARFNQWYGFGRQEEVFYRVTGTPATTAAYTATLTSEAVTPIAIEGGLVPGTITIARDTAGGNTADVDMWIYDSTLTPIAGAGNDGNDSLTRTLTAGNYILAISNFNTANNQASPPDDSFRSGSVLDFPNIVANTSQTAGLNVGIRISHPGGVITAPGTKAGAFDVVWYQFSVGDSSPSGVGAANPSFVGQGNSTFVTVTVTPGLNPVSTGIIVGLDTSAVGGSIQFLSDDGQNGDAVAGDLVFSGNVTVAANTPLGAASLGFGITDDQGRSGNGTVPLTITLPPPPNDLCTSPIVITSDLFGSQIAGTTVDTAPSPFDASGSCGGGADSRDVFYQFTATATGFWAVDTCASQTLDTVVSIHGSCPQSGSPNLVAAETCQDTTCGPGNGGARAFAFLTSGQSYIIRIATKDPITGSFTLVVNPPAQLPPNDECTGAIPIQSSEIPFNNAGASTSTAPAACSGTIAADVWFRWTAPEFTGNGVFRVTCSNPGARVALWTNPECPVSGTALACIEGGNSVDLPAADLPSLFVQVGGTPATPLVGDATVFFTFIPNTGACCDEGTLTIRTEANCVSSGGTYFGDSVRGGYVSAGNVASSGTVNIAIPDNDVEGITSEISAPDAGTITNLAVRVAIDHTFVGDLTATLSNGQITIPLFVRVGRVVTGLGSGADLSSSAPLRFYDAAAGDLWDAADAGSAVPAGEYRPSAINNTGASLNDFVGLPSAGVWTLSITDRTAANAGTLVSWELDFNPVTACTPACATLTQFSDTFDNGPAPEWGNQFGNWTAAGGEYFAQNPGNTPTTFTLLPFNVTDLAIEVDIKQVSDGGIWLRTDDTRDNGVLLVTGGNTQTGRGFYWHTVTNGSFSAFLNQSPDLFNQGDDIRIRVTVCGDTYAVFLNDSISPATTLTTSAFPSGRVGLYDFAGPAQRFDNFTLFVSPSECPGDFNNDGVVNGDDLGDYINCFFAIPPCNQADFNGDGDVNGDDLGDFINVFFTPC